MTSSAITKSGSISRISHRVINNTNTRDGTDETIAAASITATNLNEEQQNIHQQQQQQQSNQSTNGQKYATKDDDEGETSKENARDLSEISNNDGMNSASSNSANNLNIISSINLESDFIESVIEDYKNY